MECIDRILIKLEMIRLEIESNAKRKEKMDYVMRICQAVVAEEGGYKNRAEWKHLTEKEKKGGEGTIEHFSNEVPMSEEDKKDFRQFCEKDPSGQYKFIFNLERYRAYRRARKDKNKKEEGKWLRAL